jgi:hypothetical protein
VVLKILKILKWQVFRTLKSVLKHLQAAQKTKRESESEIAMCDMMQMYNIIKIYVFAFSWVSVCNVGTDVRLSERMNGKSEMDIGWKISVC